MRIEAGNGEARSLDPEVAAQSLGGDEAGLTEPVRSRLAKLEQLCPGDFAAVKRQVEILAETLPPEEFLAQLEAEHRIKPEVREARTIGFTH